MNVEYLQEELGRVQECLVRKQMECRAQAMDLERKHRLLLALRDRLDHSLSAGVENWPEYCELKEETTP